MNRNDVRSACRRARDGDGVVLKSGPASLAFSFIEGIYRVKMKAGDFEVTVEGTSSDKLWIALRPHLLEMDAVKKLPVDRWFVNAPFTAGEVSISTKLVSVGDICAMVEEGSLSLEPPYQREVVWSSKKQAALIESVLLGVSIPKIIVDRSEFPATIVDGKQRLTSFVNFLDGKLKLNNLPFLSVEPYDDGELPTEVTQGVKDFVLSVDFITPPTPAIVKYHLFARINQGGMNLNRQELRRAQLRGPMTALCANVGMGLNSRMAGSNKRKKHEEVALALCMFADGYEGSGSIADMLDSYLDEMNSLLSSDHERIPAIRVLVDEVIDVCTKILPNGKFDNKFSLAAMCAIAYLFHHERPLVDACKNLPPIDLEAIAYEDESLELPGGSSKDGMANRIGFMLDLLKRHVKYYSALSDMESPV